MDFPPQNNSKHDALRNALRVIGPLVVLTGVVFMAVGMISFFSAFGSFEPPRKFWCCFVGIPLMGVGAGICRFAYFGSIIRYISNEMTPVGKDAFNQMAHGTKDSFKLLAGAVREGFQKDSETTTECSCGTENDSEAKFCKSCGKSLQPHFCGSCGNENDADARFCDHCGKQIR